MKNSFVTVFALLFMSAPAFAAQSTNSINIAQVTADSASQTGNIAPIALVTQTGQYNEASILQPALEMNVASIEQNGMNNEASINQSSPGNIAHVMQTGSNNVINITQRTR